MTRSQILALDRLVAAASPLSAHVDTGGVEEEAISCAQERLRRCCLEFCISLLDHQLRGNIYDSLVVSFIAIKGINGTDNGFHEPTNYTSVLSAIIKMAQFLVAQRAVVGVQEGEADFPSESLDRMKDRFMVYGSRSPVEWALKLRAFGRGV
jgi:hypothetical protein